MSRTASRWRRALREGGYEAARVGRLAGIRFALLSRAWRRVLRHAGLRRTAPIEALEVGCAGGYQCVRLWANGWRCTGIDSSPEVIRRARAYAANVRRAIGPRGNVRFVVADFTKWRPPVRGYDFVFHVGVLEHFLDRRERLAFLRRMFRAARPGGWVMSMVPNGRHVLRPEMRKKGLGGYNVPEIDYSSALVASEMKRCGARDVAVLHHDVFGYLRIMDGPGFVRLARLGAYVLLQAIPWRVMPTGFLDRHASWLIGMGRKA